MASPDAKNNKVALIVLGVVIAMVGLTFASVPAYRVFCQVTGFGGTTSRAEAGAGETLARQVTVRFDGTVNPALPWRFKPEQVSQTMHVGETSLAFYQASNLSDEPITGRATYNVSPAKAGLYFRKIECFCFTEQTLQPGEEVDMPVTYFVDPAMNDDPSMADVQTITLSYTFYRYKDGELLTDDASGGS